MQSGHWGTVIMESINEAGSASVCVLEIAEAALAQSGRIPNGPPTVRRHWGISTILTFPTDAGTIWFKHVPAIFSHEG